LKAGDELTVTALAARDGSNSGLAQELKMADGRVFKLIADINNP
jgi:multidrug resistance efflux pump